MEKRFHPYEPNQLELMPKSLAEMLPEEHLCFFVSEVVDQMDLQEIRRSYQPVGGPAYEPAMMLKLLVYAYVTGEYSSRKIERRIHEEIAYRYLGGGYFPTYKAISEFRRKQLAAFRGLFLQVLQMAADIGMVKLGHVAIDGSKIRANASKHKAMSYGHMQERVKQLEDEIRAMTARAEEADRREEGRGSATQTTLPDELKRKEERLAKIREAKARLEAAAKQEDDAGKGSSDGDGTTTTVPDKAQMNFTDPESKIMKCADGSFQQAYNVQVAVDTKSQIIVAHQVVAHATDVLHLPKVLHAIQHNRGESPGMVSADAGYYSARNLAAIAEVGAEAFIPPEKTRHGTPYAPAPRGRIPKDLSQKDRMRRKLRTLRGRRIYKRRMATVEPTFADIKEHRRFRKFSLRGLTKVTAEWDLVAMAYNIRKIFTRVKML